MNDPILDAWRAPMPMRSKTVALIDGPAEGAQVGVAWSGESPPDRLMVTIQRRNCVPLVAIYDIGGEAGRFLRWRAEAS